MTEDLVIERISESNFDDFIFLVNKLAEYEKLEPPEESAVERLKADGLSAEPRYEAYVGKLGGKSIGYIIYFFNYSSFLALPTLYLEDIFVLQEYRRRGFGTRMFQFTVEQARERGCGRIEFCVLTWNEPAIKFYEKNNTKRLDWYFYRMDRAEIEEFNR
ncbi:MAG: GNAT family N-acetyltransferase [Thermoplasmata archaeon]|nr:MAG: GNAT family N-acetyltransferase [Thermoplasmata archaeon]